MIRQVIHTNEEKCNGCGLCAKACHEGAIDIIDGKAKLVREHFVMGLGIAFRPVQQEQFALKKEMCRLTMRQL